MSSSNRNRNTKPNRKYPIRDEKPTILIVCEDSKSSNYYLQDICRKHHILGKVKVTPSRLGSAPISVVNYTIELCSDKSANYDMAFCVIDRDSHQSFDLAIETAKSWQAPRGKNTELRTITSYPCFELWLLIHFKLTTTEYPKFDDILPDLKHTLREHGYLEDYKKGDKNTFSIFLEEEKTRTAITHAQHLEKEAEKVNSKNPSTEMHHLFAALNIPKNLNTS